MPTPPLPDPDDTLWSIVGICPNCHLPATATEAGRIMYKDGPSAPDWRFSLLLCENCGGPMIIYGEDGFSFTEPIWLYPLDEDATVSHEVPTELRTELIEAMRCAAHGLDTAAVVMCGRVLEGLAALHGANEPTLVRNLDRLRDLGVLDGRLVEWASELRTIRNDAAHFKGERITRENAADTVILTRTILDYVYVVTARFDEFKKRRRPDT
jgi:hypothetical protein